MYKTTKTQITYSLKGEYSIYDYEEKKAPTKEEIRKYFREQLGDKIKGGKFVQIGSEFLYKHEKWRGMDSYYELFFAISAIVVMPDGDGPVNIVEIRC